MENYLRIGKLAATFGLQGEIILVHDLGKKSDLKGLEAIFVEMRPGEMLPYFPESAKARSITETLIKLEGVDTPEATKPLIRKLVWLPEKVARKLTAASAPLSLLGYTVYQGKEALGEVLEVIEQPLQVLLRLHYKGKEVYIPIHAETLDSIDHKNRRVLVILPDGLLDVYS
jgi:16S rRNA processing protein RimM